MVTTRDLAEDFVKVVADDGVKDFLVGPMYGPLLYSEVITRIKKEQEVRELGFIVGSYWSEEMIAQSLSEQEQDQTARKAYLELLLSGVEDRMSKHFVRDYSVDDFVLFRLADGVGAGRDCGNGVYQSYSCGRDVMLFKAEDVICKLELGPLVQETAVTDEGLPAVVAQADRWSVGFPEFHDDLLVMTPDFDRQGFSSVYERPFIINGLVPVFKGPQVTTGPYR